MNAATYSALASAIIALAALVFSIVSFNRQQIRADRQYVFGSPVSRFAFALVGAILPIGNHTISEYLRPATGSGRKACGG